MTTKKVQINLRIEAASLERMDAAFQRHNPNLPMPSRNGLIENWVLDGIERLEKRISDSWPSEINAERLHVITRMLINDDLPNFRGNLYAINPYFTKLIGSTSGEPLNPEMASRVFNALERADKEALSHDKGAALQSLGLALLWIGVN
jgi:hypothetical protein